MSNAIYDDELRRIMIHVNTTTSSFLSYKFENENRYNSYDCKNACIYKDNQYVPTFYTNIFTYGQIDLKRLKFNHISITMIVFASL